MTAAFPSWLRYAITEFTHAFTPSTTGAKNRNITWMFAVLLLLISVLSVASAVYRGLVLNFSDSILGYTEGSGVPVRIRFDPNTATSGHRLEILSLFHNSAEIGGAAEPVLTSPVAAYDFHPYRSVEAGDVFGLPEGSWTTGENEGIAFAGWAVSADSPIWRYLVGDGYDQTTMLVSETAFDDAFNRRIYEEEIGRRAPSALVALWKDENPAGQRMSSLLVEIPYANGRKHYQRFKLEWFVSLPGVDRIAFLVPLQLFEVLTRTNRQDNLYAFMPGRELTETNELVMRADFIDLVYEHDDDATRIIADLTTCLGVNEDTGTVEAKTYDASFFFSVPVEPGAIDFCAARAQLKPAVEVDYASFPFKPDRPVLRVVGDSMQIACNEVSQQDWARRDELEPCLAGADVANISALGAFFEGFAYVPDRTQIQALIDAVDSAVIEVAQPASEVASGMEPSPPLLLKAFVIPEIYRASLNRLRYLVAALDYIRLPMASFFLVVAAYSLMASTSMFFDNRRVHYGVLMARGMGVMEIRAVIYTQFSTCFALAVLAAFVVLNLTKMSLQASFEHSEAFSLALRELGIQWPQLVDSPLLGDPLNSIALSWGDVAFGAGVMFWIMVGIVVFQLWRLPLRRRTFPMDLIANAT